MTMKQQKPSELFEGENSSLRKTYDAATSPIHVSAEKFTVEDTKKLNQCDGCKRGLPKIEGQKIHICNGGLLMSCINEASSSPIQQEGNKCESNGLSYLSYPPQRKCKDCGRFWVEGKAIPRCSASPEEAQEKDNTYIDCPQCGYKGVTWAHLQRTNCQDCGLPHMNGVGHVCDEKGKAKLKIHSTGFLQEVVTIDKSKATKSEDSFSDWKEKEREAWENEASSLDFQRLDGLPKYNLIADYWLARIQPLLDSARHEGAHDMDLKVTENFNKELKIENSMLMEMLKDIGRKEATARLIALAEGMKKDNWVDYGEMRNAEKDGYNQALQDFITRANQEGK